MTLKVRCDVCDQVVRIIVPQDPNGIFSQSTIREHGFRNTPRCEGSGAPLSAKQKANAWARWDASREATREHSGPRKVGVATPTKVTMTDVIRVKGHRQAICSGCKRSVNVIANGLAAQYAVHKGNCPRSGKWLTATEWESLVRRERARISLRKLKTSGRSKEIAALATFQQNIVIDAEADRLRSHRPTQYDG